MLNYYELMYDNTRFVGSNFDFNTINGSILKTLPQEFHEISG